MRRKACLLAAAMLLLAAGNGVAQSMSTVQFSSARYTVNENGDSVTLTVERSGEPGGYAYVEFAISDGSATNGVDYVGQNGFLEFFGETNLTIVIPILNDAVAEWDETFSVMIFGPEPPGLGPVTKAIVTIWDNDRGVEFSPNSYTVDENAGAAVVTVRGGTDSGNGFSIDYLTEGCSATAGMDYLPQSGTLNFAPGEVEKTIVIPILEDALMEGNECVRFRLSHAVGAVMGSRSNAVLVIRDDDYAAVENVDIEPQRVGIWVPSSGGLTSVAVAGGYAYVTSTEALHLLDVSNPASPRMAGQAAGGGHDVAVQCGYALVARFGGMDVFNISDPLYPVRVGQYEEACPYCTRYTALTIEGGYAYVAVNWYADLGGLSDSGIQIFDISDPANPRLVGTYSRYGGWGVWDVTVSGNYAYLASGWPNLTVIDISDPAHPQQVSNTPDLFVGGTYTLTVSGDYAYVTDSIVGLTVIDISDAASPQRIGPSIRHRVGPSYWPVRPGVAGKHLCLAGAGGLELFDISDPSRPLPEATYLTTSGRVTLSGHHAYVAAPDGLEVVDLSVTANPQRAGTFALSEAVKSITVSDHRAYLVKQETWDGTEWHGGVQIIDALDSAHPREVGSFNISNLVAAVAVSGNYLYVAEVVVTNGTALGGSLRVVDFSNPANPQPVGEYEITGRVYGLALRGRYAYLLEADRRTGTTAGGGGLTILDISDPSHPQRVGGNDDAIRASRFIVSGNYAYAVTNYPTGGLVIIDISDPANPGRVGGYEGKGFVGGIAVAGDYAYVAEQGEWREPRFVGGGLTVLYLGDPAHPHSLGTFSTGGTAQDVALSGHYAYVACAEGGLEIIDITNPMQLRRVGRNSSIQPTTVTVAGDHVYAGSNEDGVVILHAFRELTFESLAMRAPGEAVLTVSGPPGLVGQVQRGSNLRDWQDWRNVTFTDGPGSRQEISDPDVLGTSQHFYRVKLNSSP